MLITHQKNSKIIAAVIIVFLLLLGVGGYIWYTQVHRNTPNTNQSTTGQDNKQVDKNSVPTSSTSKDVNVTQSTSQVPVSNNISLTISSLSQTGNDISYSANISGSPNGTCAALFTRPNSKPVSLNTTSSDTTCRGTLSAYEFDSTGKWTLTLRYYVNNQQAVATKDLTIE